MNKIYILIIILIVGVLLFFGYKQMNKPTMNQPNTQNQNTTTPQNNESSINIANFSFSPKELKIVTGTKVTWTNNDSAPHQIISNTFNSEILSNGQSFSFVFNNKGSYDYHCAIHPSMTGKIIVE